MSQFDKLISELAAFSGLPLEVDGNNSCALSTDDLYITMLYRSDAGDIVIFAPVTDPDDGKPGEAVLRKALELSYNGSGTKQHFLGLFDDTREAYEAFTEKFKAKKTTDDCYTPENVHEAHAFVGIVW